MLVSERAPDARPIRASSELGTTKWPARASPARDGLASRRARDRAQRAHATHRHSARVPRRASAWRGARQTPAQDDAHERRRCVPRRPLPSGRSGRLGAFGRDERGWFKADVSSSMETLADRRTRKSATTRLSTRSRRTETSRERARSCDLAPSPRRREPRDSLTAPRATMASRTWSPTAGLASESAGPGEIVFVWGGQSSARRETGKSKNVSGNGSSRSV